MLCCILFCDIRDDQSLAKNLRGQIENEVILQSLYILFKMKTYTSLKTNPYFVRKKLHEKKMAN